MKRKGISLIVLIITVVVIIILATAIIVSLVQTNVIDAGKKAKFLNDYLSVKEAVTLYTYDEVASIDNIKHSFSYPIGKVVDNSEKEDIVKNIPSLATTILTLNPGKVLDEVDLYHIDSEKISMTEELSKKKPSGYIIDISNGQIYDYAGDKFYNKMWHIPEEGYNEKEIISTEDGEKEEIWDGWIRLTLFYPEGATNKMWRLHEEGQVRGLPDSQYDTWQEYTGSILVPLERVQDVYIRYTLNGEEVIIAPEGVLAVDIDAKPTTDACESVTVKINYDEKAEVKEYKIGNTGWQEYTGSFEVTENVMIEARATMQEKVYDSEGNLQSIKNIAGKDAYQITNIVKNLENVKDIVIDSSLSAPKIEYVDTVGDEIARLKITYPDVAAKRIYSINNAGEKIYTEEISITEGNTYVTAYYYTADGRVSPYTKVYIKDKDNLGTTTNGTSREEYPISVPSGSVVVDKYLSAPTIEFVNTVNSDEIARVKITYPSDAVNKVYKINYGKENTYTEEISITEGGKLITAYYYTEDNRMSRQASVYIGKDGSQGEVIITVPQYPIEDGTTITPDEPEMNIPAPTISHSPTDVTTSVDVTIVDVPSDAQEVYIKVGNNSYEKYTGKVTLTSNQYVYAYYIDKDGYRSNTARKRISNIRLDSNLPYVAIGVTPDVYSNTIESFEVSISSKDADRVEYSFDGVLYTEYVNSFTVTRNCTVYARAINNYGTSEDYIYITNIKGDTAPQKPKNLMVSIIADPDPTLSIEKTNEVEVTINYDSKATQKYYRIGTGEYIEYTGSFKVTQNCVIYAYAVRTDESGITTMKGSAKKLIDNLSTGLSEPIISANPTNEYTTDKTRITIDYDSNATSKKYKIDNGVEMNYTTSFEVENNSKITAIASDNLGNKKVSTYIVTNIVKPTIVTIDKGSYYIIKLNYPTVAANREYKFKESGEWKNYTDEGFMLVKPEYKDELLNAKGELIVKIENENGQKVKYNGDVYVLDVPISEVFENVFMRWDRSTPDTPVISPSTTEPTQSLYIAIQYSDKLEKKQYKVSYSDGRTTEWMPYKGLIEINQNNTVIYARGQDSAEVWSGIASYTVRNIDTVQPEISLEGDFEKITNCLKLKITATDLSGIKNVKYASGVLGASSFKTGGTAITNGSTIDITQKGYYTFYAMDNAGNEQVVTVNIVNIDIVPPEIKITTKYVDALNAKVNITYEDSITKEYKIGTNGTWQTYEGEISINSYDIINQNLYNDDYTLTIYARGIDEAGNQGTKESIIDKIDLQLPEAPVISNAGGQYPMITEYGVVIKGTTSITYPEGVQKLYSTDGETWKEYTGEFETKANIIYAKSVKSSGLEKQVSEKKSGLASDALGANTYDGKAGTYELITYTVKGRIIYISPEMQGKNISVYNSVGNGYRGFVYMYDSSKELINTVVLPSTYTTHWQEINIKENTSYICFAPEAYAQVYICEIAVLNDPVIKENKHYPVMTEYGVKEGYNEVEVEYYYTSVQKLYKIDDGEWKNYTGKIRLELGETIYAKGIDKYGNETRIISSYTASLPSDALELNAYDGSTGTYTNFYGSAVKKIYVSPEMKGKNINVYNNVSNGSYIGYTKMYDVEGNLIYTEILPNTNSINWQEINIKENTDYIVFSAEYNSMYSALIKIYEIMISNEPIIKETKYYPTITEYGIEPAKYNEIEISYFQTSVQKLYKIDDGEWINYTGKIKLEIGKTLYAKGIDKYGNETRIISSYTSELPTDALKPNAYDGNTGTYELITSTVKGRIIYISPEMQGKNISVYNSVGNGYRGFVYMYDSSNELINTVVLPSTYTTHWQEINIKENTSYICFAPESYAQVYIYEIKVSN